jgi:hypothetical protein
MTILSNDQFQALIDQIKLTVEQVIDEKELVTKADLSYLPTKDEFYEQTSKILKRLDDLEEGYTILNDRTSKHSDRLDKIETVLKD